MDAHSKLSHIEKLVLSALKVAHQRDAAKQTYTANEVLTVLDDVMVVIEQESIDAHIKEMEDERAKPRLTVLSD